MAETANSPQPEAGQERGSSVSRRAFLGRTAAASAGLAVSTQVLASAEAAPVAAAGPALDVPGEHLTDVALTVNRQARRLRIDPRVTLLDALRDRLHLTGTKKGCDRGQCGRAPFRWMVGECCPV